MCGIVAGISKDNLNKQVIESIKYLEYRGYDSAGACFLDKDSNFKISKHVGKVRDLNKIVDENEKYYLGIAHTRWATHGEVSLQNCHPHVIDNRIAIVHNGIIENFQDIKVKLENIGYKHNSQTDSEAIASLTKYYIDQGLETADAFRKTIKDLKGSFAIAAIDSTNDNELYVANNDSPLVLGLGDNGNYVASDQMALLEITNNFSYLENKSIGIIRRDEVIISDFSGKRITPKVNKTKVVKQKSNLKNYKHYMHQEIHEQVAVSKNLVNKDLVLNTKDTLDIDNIYKNIQKIVIVACGSSYNAGYVAKYWFEKLLNIETIVEVASEYRYHNYTQSQNDLIIFISQSGETADTLAALRDSKTKPHLFDIAICNEKYSSIVREASAYIDLEAGKEIGVASTKAFTAQLICLIKLGLKIASYRLDNYESFKIIESQLLELPEQILEVLEQEQQIAAIAKKIYNKTNIMFLGRNTHYPIALEGALKLKEISYINANAYVAGELKHGPLALIDNETQVVFLIPENNLKEKNRSNAEEIQARGGNIILIHDQVCGEKQKSSTTSFKVGKTNYETSPIVMNIALQILAYYIALFRGNDIDQPRNLAKSVTVE
ncbi:MAG: glutamine--fructose-6-phosphate transaminase (isomerizing) [Pseudomonadota bacterium]|nr:glutamine--fructose-6-phosphate transaminase (isomerizing) [Pseudomonadota bacterium]